LALSNRNEVLSYFTIKNFAKMTQTENPLFKFGVGDAVEQDGVMGVVTEMGDDTFVVQWEDLEDDFEYLKSDTENIRLAPIGNNGLEEDAVKLLGEKIGYGRVMELASKLWSDSLVKNHGLPGTGAFVPALHFQIKKSQWAMMRNEYPDAFPNPTPSAKDEYDRTY